MASPEAGNLEKRTAGYPNPKTDIMMEKIERLQRTEVGRLVLWATPLLWPLVVKNLFTHRFRNRSSQP